MFTAADFPTYQIDLAAKEHNRTIWWIFNGFWSPLDNFWDQEPFWYAPHPDLMVFSTKRPKTKVLTSEHAFQAMKAQTDKDFLKIAKAKTNHESKRLGNIYPNLRPDWDEVRYDVMWDVLLQKFEQCREARRVLKRSEKRHISEGNQWSDRVWGMTKPSPESTVWEGRNALGKMLMKIRDEVL